MWPEASTGQKARFRLGPIKTWPATNVCKVERTYKLQRAKNAVNSVWCAPSPRLCNVFVYCRLVTVLIDMPESRSKPH